VRTAGIRVAGFPNRFDLTVTAPAVSDAGFGLGWRGDTLQVLAMTWKPWHLIALLPLAQTIRTPDGDITVTAAKLRASVVLHPGADLRLDRTILETTDLAMTGPAGAVRVANATLATSEDTSRRNSHRIGLQINGLTPVPAVSAALPDLPAVIAGLHLDGIALLSAPLDRHAGETQPELTGLILRDATLDWRPLHVIASGSLAVTSDGLAEGRIDLTLDGWHSLPGLLGAVGVIDPVLVPTLLRALEIMAEQAGTGTGVLTLPLTFRAGRMRLGPLPIGTAPRLAYRQ